MTAATWRDTVHRDDLITATAAAELAFVPVHVVRAWARRNLLTPCGLDDRDRPLFLAADVLAVEAATRRSGRGRRRTGNPFG